MAAPASADAKTVLIEKLMVQLQVLIQELNKILQQQDVVVRTEVSRAFVNAELFYLTNNDSFKGTCNDIVPRIINSSAAKKIGFVIRPATISCYDNASQYALSGKISNGYSCADSTGFVGTTTKALAGTVCIKN